MSSLVPRCPLFDVSAHARQQFADSPPTALEPSGPALLVYYAPALVQKAGEAQVLGVPKRGWLERGWLSGRIGDTS